MQKWVSRSKLRETIAQLFAPEVQLSTTLRKNMKIKLLPRLDQLFQRRKCQNSK
jgi:hypothetical protein